LIGAGGVNTVVVSRSASLFTLTDTSLSVSGGGTFTLVNVHNAVLTGGASGTTFDVRGWTGTDTLNSQGGPNPVYTPHGLNVSATEGTSINAVASFTDLGSPVANNYTGNIGWGDATSSAATIGIQGATVTVNGVHLYAEEGSYPITTTFSQGSLFSVIVGSTASVADAQLTNVQGASLTGTEGLSTGTVLVASFTDPAGSEPLSEYTASINWADGTASTTGTVVDLGGGHFQVTGTHTYTDERTYSIAVTLQHNSLPAVIASGTAVIADAPLTASSSNLALSQGIPFTGQVATFIDGNPFGNVSDFTATVSWGDGTSSAGGVTQPGGTGTTFVVSATHAYSVQGSKSVSVHIVDVGGQSASTSFVATVGASVFVLDPAAPGALTVTGTVGINIAGTMVVDSNSSTAMTVTGNAQITANQILVVGGTSISSNATVNPPPITGISPIPDPLAALPVPPNDVNRGSVNLKSGSLTIQPGVYTSIKVSGNGTRLTMLPGVYIIKGGDFSVSNTASVIGNGVMLYNAGSNFPSSGGSFGAITLGSSGSITFTAAATGTYAGILIFQARDNTKTISLNANSVIGLVDTIYAPAALLSLGGGATLRNPTIVKLLTLNGNGGGSPVPGTSSQTVISLIASAVISSDSSLDRSAASAGTFTREPIPLSVDVTLPANQPQTTLAPRPSRDLTDEIFAVFGNKPSWDMSEGIVLS
jgi:hypothetical protein